VQFLDDVEALGDFVHRGAFLLAEEYVAVPVDQLKANPRPSNRHLELLGLAPQGFCHEKTLHVVEGWRSRDPFRCRGRIPLRDPPCPGRQVGEGDSLPLDAGPS
jgi:hypothetical protein